MAETKKLLELRKKIKKNKPAFRRADSHKVKKLKSPWRQPRGMHSKTRRKRKAKGRHPSMGYSSPRKVRGVHGSGMPYKTVRGVEDLEKLGKEEAAMVSSCLGMRKKLEVVKKALELKAVMLNIRKPEELVKKAEEAMASKKKEKKSKEEKKKKSKEEALKKAEEKKKEEEKEAGKDELAEKVEKEETKKGEKSDKIKALEKRK